MAQIGTLRDCGGGRTRLGCGVTFRFLAQVNRDGPLAKAFTQTAHAAALVRAEPGIIVSLNYVGTEDYRGTLQITAPT